MFLIDNYLVEMFRTQINGTVKCVMLKVFIDSISHSSENIENRNVKIVQSEHKLIELQLKYM